VSFDMYINCSVGCCSVWAVGCSNVEVTCYFFKIIHPIVLNYEIRRKQTTVEHNFIKYSYSYMFRHYGGSSSGLNFRTLKEVYILHCGSNMSLLTNRITKIRR